ncbi:MAG: hypothetical protein R3C40_07375 [Parvularculaceae bacterium]
MAIDQGLRAYMPGVYNYMGLGIALTGLFLFCRLQPANGDGDRRLADQMGAVRRHHGRRLVCAEGDFLA